MDIGMTMCFMTSLDADMMVFATSIASARYVAHVARMPCWTRPVSPYGGVDRTAALVSAIGRATMASSTSQDAGQDGPSTIGQYITLQVVEERYCAQVVRRVHDDHDHDHAHAHSHDASSVTDTSSRPEYLYKYPQVSATVDVVLIDEAKEHVLLIERGAQSEPACFRGHLACPGGFVEYKRQSAEDAAIDEVAQETNVHITKDVLRLVGVFSDPHRDPRGHSMSALYTALVPSDTFAHLRCNDDEEACTPHVLTLAHAQARTDWAFDHRAMFDAVLKYWAQPSLP